MKFLVEIPSLPIPRQSFHSPLFLCSPSSMLSSSPVPPFSLSISLFVSPLFSLHFPKMAMKQNPSKSAKDPDMKAISNNNSNSNSNSNSNGTLQPHHRRAHSEVTFRFTDDMDLSADPFTGSSTEEIGSEEDLFTTYIDVDKLGENAAHHNNNNNNNHPYDAFTTGTHPSSLGVSLGLAVDATTTTTTTRPRHRHSNSVDAATTTSSASGSGRGLGEIMEAKKAMPPQKLAELWTMDPKRAKRWGAYVVSFPCTTTIMVSRLG